jgi:type I restriction enzyme R subunit
MCINTPLIDMNKPHNQRPLVVVEAKSEKIEPLYAKEQARRYAETQKAKYVILSNGNIHYL